MPRPASHQNLPEWLYEGANVYGPDRDTEGVVQFIGDLEDPATHRQIPHAVFLRPEGGGREWTVLPGAVREAGPP
ncbi:hypothetical protein ACFU51_03885 [Streptomyces sp. NPDC057430]|uniref:hypothetical protein n=1 Tax=Streptomyces sp. NPDC057430 TaxID=3346131 RepID=UPI0036C82AA8